MSEQSRSVEYDERIGVPSVEENDIQESLLAVNKHERDEHLLSKLEPVRVVPGLKSKIGAALCLGLFAYWSFVALIDSSHKRVIGEPERRLAGELLPPVYQTVLVSIDGFRHDYLERKTAKGEYVAPTLQSIAKEGVIAVPHGMQPVFPTKTFPNHAALSTGLFPESSGIISNTMYDSSTHQWFHEGELDPSWWKGEPIWVTLKRTVRRDTFAKINNVTKPVANYTTATVFWPGSAVEGRKPDAFWTYNASVPYEDRVSRVVALLNGSAHDLPNGPADFVTLYFEGVDHAGHQHGVDSEEVDSEIARVDSSIASLQRLVPHANLIILSDHGMTNIGKDRYLDLNVPVKPSSVLRVVTSPLLMMHNLTVSAQKLYAELSAYFEGSSGAKAYLKRDIPSRWHLRNNPLVPPVLALAELGWTMVFSNATSRVVELDKISASVRHAGNHPVKGAHGYDNREPDMQALFIAIGPGFKSRQRVHHMRAVDVYPLICHMYGAEPAPNNGSAHVTSHILSFS